jgi:hypothetical protein
MKAINIKWDFSDFEKDREDEDFEYDEDFDKIPDLPTEIEIPEEMIDDEDRISDYLSDYTGFCHGGFDLVEEKEHDR